ncbi:hypothetical protein ACFLWD_01170 [Chloroflexota bacterium]
MEITSNNSPGPTQKTWMSTTAGILTIITGAIHLILGIVVIILSRTICTVTGLCGWGVIGAPLLGTIGVPLILLGIVSIIGGSFALRRRVWGMALTGAICALFLPPVGILGILAIIFMALSKKEFV